ncbi:MAG: hypothetical protein MUF38_06005 [Anaerolineae bacterium]|nr:hypothetical protein [Anaerolineae bacterium]
MATQAGYHIGNQFIESDSRIKTGYDILVEAGKDPSRTVVAVNVRGERTIIDQHEQVEVERYTHFEDLPSFIYG